MDTDTSRKSPLAKLGIISYNEWESAMYGRMMYLGVTRIINGKETVISDPGSSSDVTSASMAAYNAYATRCEKAAGEIYQWLDEANKVHVLSIREDPKAMWDKLALIHNKSAPNSRFNSLSDLFSIRLKEDETLTQLTARVEGAMQTVVNLRPKEPPYTLSLLDEELAIMAMIRALPREDYNPFISSVLLLSTLTKDAVLEAFRVEETQRRGTQAEIEAAAVIAAAAAARDIKCHWCGGPHMQRECASYIEARSSAQKLPASGGKKKNRGGRGAGRGANRDSANASKVEEGCDGVSVKAESATLAPQRI